MPQISTIEDIQNTIRILDRHLNTLHKWHQEEDASQNRRTLRDSASLHIAMRFYCDQLRKLLQDEHFKEFDRKYLHSAEQIPPITLSIETPLPDNPGIQDCSNQLIQICHYALALRQLSHQKSAVQKEYHQPRARLAAQVEKLAVFFVISLTIVTLLLVATDILAMTAPFLLYFCLPAILVTGCIILPLAVTYQNNPFARELDALKSTHPIIFQDWFRFSSKMTAETIDKIVAFQQPTDTGVYAQIRRARARTRNIIQDTIDSCTLPPDATTKIDVPRSASDFVFFHYAHPKHLVDNPPPRQFVLS